MPDHPLDQVYSISYLPELEFKGLVTVKYHVIKIKWKPKESLSISSTYKALCECVSGEAALMKGQTEVIIRNKIHSVSPERQTKHHYDPHITAHFPGLNQNAHVYIGPENENDYRKMKIWRRQGKPAIVFC